MAKAEVKFHNHTTTKVIFGLFNGVNSTDEDDEVDPNDESKTKSIEANMRTVAAWLAGKDGTEFYPNNDNPFIVAQLFNADTKYDVDLYTDRLSVTQRQSD